MKKLGSSVFALIVLGAVGLFADSQVQAKGGVQTLAPAGSTAPHATAPKPGTAVKPVPTAIASTKASSSAPPPPPPPTGAASSGPTTHGMWVWRTMFHLQAGATSPLIATCRTAGVTEIYLAVDAKILADKRLPALIKSVTKEGIHVDALMGDATWYQPEGQVHMLALIDAVGDYNKKHPSDAFAGIHLDIEPHQLAQNKGTRTWLPALADTIRLGRDRAMKYTMEATADLPRFAIDDANARVHALFSSATPRLFLMLYELKDRSASALVSAAASTANNEYGADHGGQLVIGVSVDDYPNVATNLRALDAGKPGAAHYGGWAIHDEARYTTRLAQHGQ